MESSPLKFLDNDVSQMLCEQVRLSKEEEARRFHDDLYHNGEKTNKVSHNFIVRIYGHMANRNSGNMATLGADAHPDSIHPYILRRRLYANMCMLKGLPSRYHVPVTIIIPA